MTLPVPDVAASAAFYRRLGFTQIVDAAHYARFECPDGGATFSIHESDGVPAEPAAVVYFECDDLDGRVRELKDAGVTFESGPCDEQWLWREARLRDPAGNRLCLYHAGENRRFPPWRVAAG